MARSTIQKVDLGSLAQAHGLMAIEIDVKIMIEIEKYSFKVGIVAE